MQCQQHPHIKDTHKCITCLKFCCSECSKLHRMQNHQTITLLELANLIKAKITTQINRMNFRIMQFSTLKDWENGESIILGCMNQIIDYIKKLFEQIKLQYRKISDQCWSHQNTDNIQDIEKKRNVLQHWKQNIEKRPEQVAYFDLDRIYELNKIDSDEQLIDSSQSYILSTSSPKIVFNQIALRRANQSLSKIIYTYTKNKASSPVRIKHNKLKSQSFKIINNTNSRYISLCKFIEGTNIMYEYIVQNPQTEQLTPILHKIQFRQFVSPLKSASLTIGNGIYLIGGCNKQNRPRKQILYYQRNYNTMRIIGLLKEGRIGHAVYGIDQNIYVFGGKTTKSLQIFNLKTKTSVSLTPTKYQVIGASMTHLNCKLYIFGGTDGVQPFKSILCYNLQTNQISDFVVYNMSLYSMPICPVLHPINEHQILIFGGYFSFAGNSYNNNYMTVLDTRLNYFSIISKGQLIYPIIANGQNTVLKQGKLISLVDLKRLRNRHGPNLPVLFTYNLTDDNMQLDAIGL